MQVKGLGMQICKQLPEEKKISLPVFEKIVC